MLQKVEGIVIRTTDYGESNKIVTLFTRENGKIGMMARGAKKPKSRLVAVSQLFVYGMFLMQKSSGLATLQQGEIIDSFRDIREDLMLTAYCSYVVELTDRLTENGQRNPFLFELLYQTLHFMNEGVDPQILTRIFEVKMLQVAGIAPQLDRCACCHQTEGEFAFSFKEGGFICHRCYHLDPHHLKISQATAKLLRLFAYLDLKRLGQISVKKETKEELKQVLTTYYDHYSGLSLKSRRFLEQVEKLDFS
ncbi:MAG TPA: DNA repair protein RecO [Bacilli bacterium]|nr:DNA repair protein RecO [Bacilli bacterium]